MKFALLSDADHKAIDALKEHYGGAAAIDAAIAQKRNFETRKKILAEKGFGELFRDLLSETLLDDAFRSFAGTETGDFCLRGIG